MQKEFSFLSQSEKLPAIRQELRTLLGGSGFEDEATQKILLAVDEALTNVVRHCYKGQVGDIKVLFRDLEGRVEIEIRDQGEAFDPRTIPDPELPPKTPGGLGVYFMRSIMDTIDYEYKDGNWLKLTKLKSKARE